MDAITDARDGESLHANQSSSVLGFSPTREYTSAA